MLTGFDRIVFGGTLRHIGDVAGRERVLGLQDAAYFRCGKCVQQAGDRVTHHARDFARRHSRPHVPIESPQVAKEPWAADIAERDGSDEGLVCVCGGTERCQASEDVPDTARTSPWLRKKTRQWPQLAARLRRSVETMKDASVSQK